MPERTAGAVVITTIAAPTPPVRAFAAVDGWDLVVVGDRKTPANWSLPRTTFLDVPAQEALACSLAPLLRWNHYCRKNLGYLHAIAAGHGAIAESDDDNAPLGDFPSAAQQHVTADAVSGQRWVNVYRFYTEDRVWPRGYPLERVLTSRSEAITMTPGTWSCPVQQYLADGDPDVDAVYRLVVGKDDHVLTGPTVVLDAGTYTPFNSQSTVWFPDAYPLMYLPSFVSFRMTDIWRSLVAQACLHAAGHRLAYHPAGVVQERNAHDLMRDFADELPGYQGNAAIVDLLASLPLPAEPAASLRACYEALVAAGHVPADELPLVRAWLADVEAAADARAR